jgi:plasmid stability protein
MKYDHRSLRLQAADAGKSAVESKSRGGLANALQPLIEAEPTKVYLLALHRSLLAIWTGDL